MSCDQPGTRRDRRGTLEAIASGRRLISTLRPIFDRHLILIVLLTTLLPSAAPAHATELLLHPGALEAGLAGTLTSVEGNAVAAVDLDLARYTSASNRLFAAEIRAGYRHAAALDELSLEGSLAWMINSGQNLYPYVGLAGGLRETWVGSFRQARFPIGFNLGLRNPLSARAALRFEYRWRRILDDPVANFTEYQLVAGVSVFWHNEAP